MKGGQDRRLSAAIHYPGRNRRLWLASPSPASLQPTCCTRRGSTCLRSYPECGPCTRCVCQPLVATAVSFFGFAIATAPYWSGR